MTQFVNVRKNNLLADFHLEKTMEKGPIPDGWHPLWMVQYDDGLVLQQWVRIENQIWIETQVFFLDKNLVTVGVGSELEAEMKQRPTGENGVLFTFHYEGQSYSFSYGDM